MAAAEEGSLIDLEEDDDEEETKLLSAAEPSAAEPSAPPPQAPAPQPPAASQHSAPETSTASQAKANPNAVPRQTVAAIQRRRAAAAEQERANKKDKGAAICLTAAIFYASGVFIYAMWYGKMQVLEEHRESAGWIGEGLIETVKLKQWIFVKVPLQTVIFGLVWLMMLWAHAKLVIWLTILGGGAMSIIASVFVLLHGSAHDNQDLIIVGVTAAFVTEARAWLTLRGAKAEGQNRYAIFDCVPLVSATLLVLLLFLEAAAVAAAIHLWGIPVTIESSKIVTLSTSMRFFLPGIVLTAAWGCFFVDAVHRATISSLVSGRFFAQAQSSSVDDAESGAQPIDEPPEGQSGVAPTPLVCLHASVEKHGPALSKGSAVVTFYHFFRRIQILLERLGTRGKRMVTDLIRTFPFLVHAVYVSPHAYVLLAQRQQRSSFFAAAKEVFKLFARNPEGKVVRATLGPALIDSGRILAGSIALTTLVRGVEGDHEGKGIHLISLLACLILSVTVFHHIAAIAIFSFDAICVCYVQNAEQCRPSPPSRCSPKLNEAVDACLELMPHDDFEEKEKMYSADREAAHSGDSL